MRLSQSVKTVFHLLGVLLLIQGGILLTPLIFALLYREYAQMASFAVPSVLCFLTGILLRRLFPEGVVYYLQSILICGLAWIVMAFFGCLPFVMGAGISFLDAYFETISGMTTTGITIFTDIEVLDHAILFWRSLIQWLGGLGILTLFLAITFRSSHTYFQLFSAESHKIDVSRPTPSIYKTVAILWSLYIFFTFTEFIGLSFLGVGYFDSLCHSLTTMSTGGFSNYNASIDYFRLAGYEHWQAIEYLIAFFMFLGGINFLLHFKIMTGKQREVIGNIELRYYLFFIAASTGLVMLDHYIQFSDFNRFSLENVFRQAIFTVISLITTTGFGTTDINMPFFPPMSKQLFLMLMFIGGCVGSTAGGIKVVRITILLNAFLGQLKRLRMPRKAFYEVVIDRKIIPDTEIKRVAGLFFGWILFLLAGGLITALFTGMSGWQAFSGMFSAMGNIGPCYISVAEIAALPAVVKITYIAGMLAGRLEILPILLLFSRKAWR